MSGIRIEGNISGHVAEVDASNNLKVAQTQDLDLSGYTRMMSENDAGDVTGTPFLESPETTRDYRLRTSVDTVMFQASFEGTNIARDRIQQNNTTATAAQASGFLTLNSASSTTAGQGTNIRTYRTFPLFGSAQTHAEFWAREGNPTATNAITEFGFGYCSGVTAQLTDGVFFRRSAGGQLHVVVVNNSVDTVTADVVETNIPSRDESGAYDATEVNHYLISLHNDTVDAWINDVLVASIPVVSPYGAPTSASSQPVFARVYNSGTASAARSLGIGYLCVTQGDLATIKPWSHQLVGSGGGAYQIQPGTTSGPNVTRGAGTLGWPTSATARIAGTWTATTAPALNSLGGLWTSPAISTLTSDADYPIFSYLNPAGTATLPGKTLYITGIRVGELCVGAAASTNSIILAFAAGIGSTTSATTATEAATVVAARIIPLGQVAFAATAAVGDYKPGWDISFSESPLVCYPGHYVQFICRPFGTVTSNTLTVLGCTTFIGYFE